MPSLRSIFCFAFVACIAGCSQPPQPGDPLFEDQVFSMTEYDAWTKDELQMISFHSRISGYVSSDEDPESEFMFLVGRPGPILVTLITKEPEQDLDMEIFSADRSINIGSFNEMQKEAFLTVLPRGAFYLTVSAFNGASEYELTLSYPTRDILNMTREQSLYHFGTRLDKECQTPNGIEQGLRTFGDTVWVYDNPELKIYTLEEWFGKGRGSIKGYDVTRSEMPITFEGRWETRDEELNEFFIMETSGEVEIEYAFAGIIYEQTEEFKDGITVTCNRETFINSGQKLL